jgi:hypothetical protein
VREGFNTLGRSRAPGRDGRPDLIEATRNANCRGTSSTRLMSTTLICDSALHPALEHLQTATGSTASAHNSGRAPREQRSRVGATSACRGGEPLRRARRGHRCDPRRGHGRREMAMRATTTLRARARRRLRMGPVERERGARHRVLRPACPRPISARRGRAAVPAGENPRPEHRTPAGAPTPPRTLVQVGSVGSSVNDRGHGQRETERVLAAGRARTQGVTSGNTVRGRARWRYRAIHQALEGFGSDTRAGHLLRKL